MYSRSYFTGNTDINVPENYDGVAFSQDTAHEEIKIPKIEPVKNEIKFSPKDEECESKSTPDREDFCESCDAEANRGGIFGFDIKGTLSSLFSGSKLSRFIPKDFGIEEILLIGLALFLLFSPDHDIECALLLLALIFIR